jgi:hypothetical protein
MFFNFFHHAFPSISSARTERAISRDFKSPFGSLTAAYLTSNKIGGGHTIQWWGCSILGQRG